MDQQTAVVQLSSFFPVFVSSVKHANDDFEAWVPEGPRLTVEDSRPKLVHSRILHYLEMHFGRTGPRRIVKENDLRYLLVEIENENFDIGVRVKKLDENFLSCNIFTDQQERLRHDGFFFWMAKPTYHVLLGYRLSGGLQRSLSHIVLTYETKDPRTHHRQVEWVETLWTASEGVFPFRETQDNFLAPPTPPKIRRRRTTGTDDTQSGNTEAG